MSTIPYAQIKAVFSDLDDTLTEASKIEAGTFETLWKLHEAGIWLVIVSGRPAGWADCLMRLWPIDAMIFENGAGLMVRDEKRIKTITLANDRERDEQIALLREVFEELRNEIPHVKLATDQPYRLFDFAVDFAEEPPHLSEAEIEVVLNKVSSRPELTGKLSSIHVNYWYGKHTKVTACEYLLGQEGKRRAVTKDDVVFCGDSPNDEPLFAFFRHSVGVANVSRFLSRMKYRPSHVTKAPGGRGFQEFARPLVSQAR